MAPIYFWREFEEPYGFLSQWYHSPFTVDGTTYHTAEMWMMMHKARTFNDEASVQAMLQTREPRRHKALGRQVRGFDAAVWDQHKTRVVEEGNLYKFTRGRAGDRLGEKLLATGDRELVEASPVDAVWGIGVDAGNADANRDHWGLNLLGKAIEVVRARIRAGEEGGGEEAGAEGGAIEAVRAEMETETEAEAKGQGQEEKMKS